MILVIVQEPMQEREPRITVKSALLSLLLVALIGLWMRGAPFFELYFPYEHWLHAHSHLGMLGWVYLALLAGTRKEFLQGIPRTYYHWLLAGTLFCVLGMTVSFPVQGYAFWSILFSSLFLLASYILVALFFKANGWKGGPLSKAFLRAAMGYLVLSSFGAWALGPIVAQGMKEDPLYRLCIYGFLHFQYNGWMSFALLGLLFRSVEKKGGSLPPSTRIGYWLLHIACIPAYTLSALWTDPHWSIYVIGGAAAFAQLIALLFLLPGFQKLLSPHRRGGVRFLFTTAILAFTLKLLLQFLSAFPYFAELAFLQRNFVIGYLHLVLLGFISTALLGYFLKVGWLAQTPSVLWGIGLFLGAFFISELLIFYAGGVAAWGLPRLPFQQEALFGVSALFPIGTFLLLSKKAPI